MSRKLSNISKVKLHVKSHYNNVYRFSVSSDHQPERDHAGPIRKESQIYRCSRGTLLCLEYLYVDSTLVNGFHPCFKDKSLLGMIYAAKNLPIANTNF